MAATPPPKRKKAVTATLGWTKSVMDRPSNPRTSTPVLPLDAADRDLVLIPQRHEQTAESARPESEAWAHATLARTEAEAHGAPRSLMHYLAETRLPALPAGAEGATRNASVMGPTVLPVSRRGPVGQGRGDARLPKALRLFGGNGAHEDRLMGGAPVPLETRLIMASNHLLDLSPAQHLAATGLAASGAHGRGSLLKIGTPQTGPIGAYIQFAMKPQEEEYEHLFRTFFAEDTWSADDVAALEQSPSSFAPMKAMVQQQGKSQRYERLTWETAVGDQPRAKALPVLNRAYLTKFRLPMPDSSNFRACRSGELCLFRALNPVMGYVAREFLLEEEAKWGPEVLAERKPEPGYCIDCLLYYWSDLVIQANRGRRTHTLGVPLNTFTVLVGAGEYDEECLLKKMTKDGQPTGIEGHVPNYERIWRDFRKIPAAYMALVGTSHTHYLAEVNMDFR